MKVLIVNNYQEHCGIYQHGKRMAEVFITDSRYDTKYLEAATEDSFANTVNEYLPDVIFYNWNASTLPWLTPQVTYSVKAKQLFFFHEFDMPHTYNYDAIVMANMSENIIAKTYGLPRVLFEYDLPEIKKNDIINVGSFGFGFFNKGFERLCQRVTDEFDQAVINLHITSSFFGDPHGSLMREISERCINNFNSNSIRVNVTNNFMSDEELVRFLNKNDINMFLYDYEANRGMSSATDYAISAGRPFGTSNSSMFDHINELFPQINADNNSIKEILEFGTAPSEYFKSQWSNQKLKNKFYYILKEVTK